MNFGRIADFRELARFPLDGYESGTSYRVAKHGDEGRMSIELELYERDEPFIKKWEPFEADRDRMTGIVDEGNSYLLFDGGAPVGIFLLERYEWNNCLNIELIEVVRGLRGRGYGRLMLEKIYEIALGMGVRAIRLEAQATNGAAIGFYMKNGYALEGLDLSFYSNEDAETQEIAVFMKRKIPRR